MHYIWYSAKHTHVYWSPIRNIFSCIQRKVLRKLIVVCLGQTLLGHHTCLEGSIGTQDPDKVPWYVPFTLTASRLCACARKSFDYLILKKSLHISEILYSGRCWTNVLAYFGQIEQTKRNAANKQKCVWNCKSDSWVWQNLNIKWTSYFSKYLEFIRINFQFLSDFVLFCWSKFYRRFRFFLSARKNCLVHFRQTPSDPISQIQRFSLAILFLSQPRTQKPNFVFFVRIFVFKNNASFFIYLFGQPHKSLLLQFLLCVFFFSNLVFFSCWIFRNLENCKVLRVCE